MSFQRRVIVPAQLLAAVIVLVQCGAPAPPHAPTPPPSAAPSSSTAVPPSSTSPPSVPPAPAAWTVEPVTAAELGTTWQPGCPVEPDQLRRVDVDYLGFDGQTHRGALVVHEDLVPDVIAIFGQLHLLRYPIDKIQTGDHYAHPADGLPME